MRSPSERAPHQLAATADRRMWVVIGIYTAIGLALASIADLPVGLTAENWRTQLWMVLAYVAANAVMTVYRVDRNNALRRTNETLTEMLWVVGLFWLTPWVLIVGRIVAAFVAWHFTKMRWQWRIYNAVIYANVSIVLTSVYRWIAPANAHDGWRAVLVAVSVWLLNDVIRIGGVFFLNWARYDRPRADLILPTLSTSYLRGIACAFGLLIAVAIEISPWMLIAVAAVGVLFVVVSKANSRAASLDAGIDQISRFSAATANAEQPDQVEYELLRSVEAFGRLETVAIATIATGDGRGPELRRDDHPGDPPFEIRPHSELIEWSGRRRAQLDATVGTASALVRLADGEPQVTFDRRGTVAAWRLDRVRGTYLVAESAETVADQTDLWSTVGHLVDHARLAIDTVYKSRRLTDLAEQEYERARRDPLTGLPNRLAALGEISERLVSPNAAAFSLVLVESLGYQESVNLLGRDYGDSAVVRFADHLADVDDVDYVAHVAAAQFVLLAPPDHERARRVAEQACASPTPDGRNIDRRSPADPFAQRIAVAGIAIADGQTESAEELMRSAGIALDRASHDDQIASFGPTDAVSAERRMTIRLQLGAAIDQKRIYPEFQPQISLATGVMSGCEVLARWQHAELGPVSPVEFIPVAEQSGQIDRLTLTIAEQALDAARWWDDGTGLGMSINISARSLDSPAFVRALLRLVDESGRPTSSTTIEITESMLVDRSTMLLALESLRELGFRISIDDFGTGYSALSYLDRLPADEIKIDQSIVRPISPDAPVSPVINHLIELSQALGHTVCAEGVEDQYQLHVLRSLGCDLGQGYLFSRPLSADGMTNWVAAHRLSRANERHLQLTKELGVDQVQAASSDMHSK